MTVLRTEQEIIVEMIDRSESGNYGQLLAFSFCLILMQ